jgi:hypothetical protein
MYLATIRVMLRAISRVIYQTLYDRSSPIEVYGAKILCVRYREANPKKSSIT